MITDEDLVPFEFADFFDDEDGDDGDDLDDAAPSSQTPFRPTTSSAISSASRTMAMILGIGWHRI
jgi:hypothetical protein